MNGISAVFIDAGYLDKLIHFEFGGAKIDYAQLVDELAKPGELLRAYYYHCMPYQSNPPTADEKQRYASKHRFVTALSHLPRFQVRLGRLAKRGVDAEGKPIFVQKGVDCMVGVDMALMAAKGKITHISLLSGDSDFVPAVEAVKAESVLVTLWHGPFGTNSRPSRELVKVCDERREIDQALVDRILRP